VAQFSYAGAYTRSVNSWINFCVCARPVAGLYCSAVARLNPLSSGRGSRGTSTRVVVLLLRPSLPKIRHSQPNGEEEVRTGDEAARGAVSGNASDERTSAETLVKGK